VPATTGGDPDASAALLSERIGAEFDRRLDARLTAREPSARSPAGTRPGLPADAVPGAGQRPRPSAGVNRLPRRPLWFGIVIGSVVSGIAAVVAGVGISDWGAVNVGGSEPELYVNAAGDILAGLTVVWTLLLLACIAHALAGRARDRRRPP
jgi:hypothetical protein